MAEDSEAPKSTSTSGNAAASKKENGGGAANGKTAEIDTLPIETEESDAPETFKGYDDSDEFEEFPIHDEHAAAPPTDGPKELNQWENNWEDEDETVEQDFAEMLDAELSTSNSRSSTAIGNAQKAAA